jgi:hypothetical protein
LTDWKNNALIDEIWLKKKKKLVCNNFSMCK